MSKGGCPVACALADIHPDTNITVDRYGAQIGDRFHPLPQNVFDLIDDFGKCGKVARTEAHDHPEWFIRKSLPTRT